MPYRILSHYFLVVRLDNWLDVRMIYYLGLVIQLSMAMSCFDRTLNQLYFSSDIKFAWIVLIQSIGLIVAYCIIY